MGTIALLRQTYLDPNGIKAIPKGEGVILQGKHGW